MSVRVRNGRSAERRPELPAHARMPFLAEAMTPDAEITADKQAADNGVFSTIVDTLIINPIKATQRVAKEPVTVKKDGATVLSVPTWALVAGGVGLYLLLR